MTFAGFFISNIVNPIIAFSLGLSTPFNAYSFEGYMTNIPFDIINIDTRNGWDRYSNVYIVQVGGVYVISLTLTALARDYPFVQLRINSQPYAGLHFGSNNTNGIETLSRTVLLNLSEGDNLAAMSNTFITSDIHYQMGMKGFLYIPHQHVPISWFVALESKGDGVYYTGPRDPLDFNFVSVNQGNGWNSTRNIFLTPVSGVYYIQLTSGISEAKPTKMELLVNGLPIINVYRQLASHNGLESRSRAVIWRLQQGDELRVRLSSGYYIYVASFYNKNRYTSFGGFYLYA